MVSTPSTCVVALAVLFAGLTNAHAHVHYCFDGQEPPAAVHLADSTDHDHELPGHSDGDDHDDLDVDVPNQALTKACKHDVPAITSQVWTSPFEAVPAGARADGDDLSPAPDPRYAHPQLRAPPR